MKVSLFGLGYVGCVSAACFAEAGHRVIGVDVNPLKVDILNSGQSPIVEESVAALIMNADCQIKKSSPSTSPFPSKSAACDGKYETDPGVGNEASQFVPSSPNASAVPRDSESPAPSAEGGQGNASSYVTRSTR